MGKEPFPNRIVKVLYLMYEMNTKGAQRKKEIGFYLNKLFPRFYPAEFKSLCKEATDFRDQVVENCVKPLNNEKTSAIKDDYILGLVVGDGSFQSDFDFREGRKATISKSLSISLLKTDQNLEILKNVSKEWDVNWNFRQGSDKRYQVSIVRKQVINEIIQPYFLTRAEKLPDFKNQHLEGWLKVDELISLLKNYSQTTDPNKEQKLETLLTQVYFIHGGTYRKISIEQVIERFKEDWT